MDLARRESVAERVRAAGRAPRRKPAFGSPSSPIISSAPNSCFSGTHGSAATCATSPPSRDAISTMPPASGRRTVGHELDPGRLGEPFDRGEPAGVVVVAGDHEHRQTRCSGGRRAPCRRSARPRPTARTGRTCRRRRASGRPARRARSRRPRPGRAAASSSRWRRCKRLADVPVAGVENPHRSNRRERIAATAGRAPRSAGSPRLGNGKRICSGTGICGWESIIEPGFRIAARWRATADRKPYSHAFRLGGVEPPHDADRRSWPRRAARPRRRSAAHRSGSAPASGRARRCRAAPP